METRFAHSISAWDGHYVVKALVKMDGSLEMKLLSIKIALTLALCSLSEMSIKFEIIIKTISRSHVLVLQTR